MTESSSPTPKEGPEPRYYQFRLPVPTQRAVVGTALALLVAGGAVFGGMKLYQQHQDAARLAEARAAFAPLAKGMLDRSSNELAGAEADLDRLGKEIEHEMTLKSSKAIEVDGYSRERYDLEKRLQTLDGGLSALKGKETELVATDKLPATTNLLGEADLANLKALHGEAASDLGKVAALDPRLTALAQRRDVLAKAEEAAAEKVAADRARQMAAAAEMQQGATGPIPAQVITDNQSRETVVTAPQAYVAPAPVYYAAPAYPYGYAPGYYDPYYNGYYNGYAAPSVFIGFGGGRGRGWHH